MLALKRVKETSKAKQDREAMIQNEYKYFTLFYEDMNMGHSGTRYYPLLFILRRFIFIVFVLLVGSHPWI